MKKFWSVFLRIATYGLGHQDAVKQIVADARAKKLNNAVDEVQDIVADYRQQ